MQKLIDAAEGRLQARAVGLAVLRRAGAQGGVRSRRVAGQAVLRARSRAAGRRLLRREQALRPDVQGAQGHPGLPARRARVRGVRRRRQVARALLRRLLQARQQARRRVDGQLRRPEPACSARKPVVFNVFNFTKPAAGQPALLSFDDVDDDVPRVRPRAARHVLEREVPDARRHDVPRDFVEFPSQFNEHWALEPTVFANYAKHYKTGAPMPDDAGREDQEGEDVQPGLRDDRVPRRRAARHGVAHAARRRAASRTSNAFETAALKRYNVDLPQVPPRYRTTYFSHIWGGGYAAGYYAYLWSEVLDDDAYCLVQGARRHDARRTASASAT